MADDGDRLLNVIGAALVVALVVVIVVGVVIAVNVPANRVDPPDAEWSFHQANETHVRITHDAGEAVDGAALVVTVDGYSRHPPWSREVRAGEAVAVEASRSQVVRLYWDGGRSDRVQLASRYGTGTRTSTE
ncbi:type IV pilin [Halococcus agarilyticus]|uniref:type IV pilin n=1 Tax=Halococcus agarilyticus TaxID=1232219 RepID=UPI000677F179|nr:type IV pilin [Halococcus agarilyticus]